MNKYTIFCTKEQVKKAYELGAPIMTFGYGDLGDIKDKVLALNKQVELSTTENNGILVGQIPTAEQMISWLEEQDVLCDVFPIGDFGNDGFGMRIMIKSRRRDRFESDCKDYSSRKEATFAAIDAALDFLLNIK